MYATCNILDVFRSVVVGDHFATISFVQAVETIMHHLNPMKKYKVIWFRDSHATEPYFS
jgi:hypothetical protein